MIFHSKRGECLSAAQLYDLYFGTQVTQMECGRLAHLVSCPSCLDELNRMLGLPLLSERAPTETLGRDKRPKGPGSGGSKGGGTLLGSWRKRARRVFEHKPQELCVSVNGYIQGSQTVNSELSELNLNINLPEDISFVEVFSEQKLRLVLLNVDELPPTGPGECAQLVEMRNSVAPGLCFMSLTAIRLIRKFKRRSPVRLLQTLRCRWLHTRPLKRRHPGQTIFPTEPF